MIKLVLAVFGLVFAASVVLATLIFVVWSLLKALVTGKKPAPLMAFGKFQRFSAQDIWAGRQPGQQPAPLGEVVDVEAREVRDDKRLP